LASEARAIAGRIGFQKGEAMALKNIGIGYYKKGFYAEAMENWRQSLSIFESLKDTTFIANLQANIGAIYSNNGNDSKSLEFAFISLRNSEMSKDTGRMLAAFNNIGAVYKNKKATHAQAKFYYLKAFWIAQPNHLPYYSYNLAMGLSEIYLDQPNADSALFYLKAAELTSQTTEDLCYVWINMGKAYAQKEEWDNAYRHFQRSYDSASAAKSKPIQVSALKELGAVYLLSGNQQKAIPIYNEAVKIARELNLDPELVDIYKGLSTIYSYQGNYAMAHRYQSLLIDIKDSLYIRQTDQLNASNEF